MSHIPLIACHSMHRKILVCILDQEALHMTSSLPSYAIQKLDHKVSWD